MVLVFVSDEVDYSAIGNEVDDHLPNPILLL
jgi:hypothetical protein